MHKQKSKDNETQVRHEGNWGEDGLRQTDASSDGGERNTLLTIFKRNLGKKWQQIH